MRPDTNPPVDDPAVVDFILRRARDDAKVRIFPSAALTKGLLGREIAEIGLLAEVGAITFSDGALSVAKAQTMRRAMTYVRDFDALVAPVCEDRSLRGEGVMAEGLRASRLGLPGVPRAAETIALERDLRLVALTGARYHAALVSNRLSLEAMTRNHDAGLGARIAEVARETVGNATVIRHSDNQPLLGFQHIHVIGLNDREPMISPVAAATTGICSDRWPSPIILTMEPPWLAAIAPAASRCSRNPWFVFTHQPRRDAEPHSPPVLDEGSSQCDD